MRGSLPAGWVLALFLVHAGQAPAAPVGVSPGSFSKPILVAGRCPTFLWGAVDGAQALRLEIWEISEAAEPLADPVLQIDLAGSATGWTPSLERCLAPGGRYAWSVREVVEGRTSGGSEARLFAIAGAPSGAEVEEALSVLRRYAAPGPQASGSQTAASAAAAVVHPAPTARRRTSPPAPAASPGNSAVTLATPALSSPSLSVDGQIALGSASDFFRDGEVFLWQSTAANQNLALGSGALAATSSSSRNTAVGVHAMRSPGDPQSGNDNTALGHEALYYATTGGANTAIGRLALEQDTTGSFNTAFGAQALRYQETGTKNTALGEQALFSNTAGSRNTAVGQGALHGATGSDNIAVGYNAGNSVTTGSGNILIGNPGTSGDGVSAGTETIRIGEGQGRTYVAGIYGVAVGSSPEMVYVDDTGRLGSATVSSQRFKEEIRDIGTSSSRLLALRPVSFLRKDARIRAQSRQEFGLIAEEVAEVFPELVIRDADGKPRSVRYQQLSTLLLNELQRQARTVRAQRRSERLLALALAGMFVALAVLGIRGAPGRRLPRRRRS